MQQSRTRHASLDFPRSGRRLSPQEEWGEFLSASMLALTTDDDEEEEAVGSRSLDSLSGMDGLSDLFRAQQQQLQQQQQLHGGALPPQVVTNRDDRMAFGSVGTQKRRDSFSESLTSSTGSSPAGATWRPLGRRASAHLTSSSSLNQLEHRFDNSQFTPDRNATSPGTTKGSNNNIREGKRPHSSSFREVVNSCLSSSDSSLVDSLSSDEDNSLGRNEIQAVTNGSNNNNNNSPGAQSSSNNGEAQLRPGIMDVDPAYAASCLPVLSSLPPAAPSIVVDSRPSAGIHAKSPVLRDRKESDTWQMQDEELLTSPRFGPFRASLDEAVFAGGMGLFAEGSNNQMHDEREQRPRLTKDARASSADFTYSRLTDINPPLPPTQEPLRLRARSFSYSATYGASNYNPAYANKPYITHHPPQQDFPATMRQFHSGMPAPPQPSPMHHQAPIRPPRVNIPTEGPMPPYHQPIPPPMRRYSTDFPVPAYPDAMPHEPEGLPGHRTPTRRGIRSYSVEYFPPNARVRTQSMEGHHMYVPGGPPGEYSMMNPPPPGGLSYEWPGSPLGAPPAPPLPPDVRSRSGNGQYPSPPPEAYYEVEFKRGRTELFAGDAGFNAGDAVKVEADRGEDIGKVVRRISDISKASGVNPDAPAQSEDPLGRPKRHDLPGKKIISVASPRECELLNEQRREEHEVFEVCKSKVRQRLLPMNVIDAEYQFDRHKLTFFFEADRRIDFRELVRDLFAIYKTRIWLQQVVPSAKKVTNDGDISN